MPLLTPFSGPIDAPPPNSPVDWLARTRLWWTQPDEGHQLAGALLRAAELDLVYRDFLTRRARTMVNPQCQFWTALAISVREERDLLTHEFFTKWPSTPRNMPAEHLTDDERALYKIIYDNREYPSGLGESALAHALQLQIACSVIRRQLIRPSQGSEAVSMWKVALALLTGERDANLDNFYRQWRSEDVKSTLNTELEDANRNRTGAEPERSVV